MSLIAVQRLLKGFRPDIAAVQKASVFFAKKIPARIGLFICSPNNLKSSCRIFSITRISPASYHRRSRKLPPPNTLPPAVQVQFVSLHPPERNPGRIIHIPLYPFSLSATAPRQPFPISLRIFTCAPHPLLIVNLTQGNPVYCNRQLIVVSTAASSSSFISERRVR